ncbi:MAG: transposase DNA-binding-containing protein [Thermodesulfobacteriota bacterium]
MGGRCWLWERRSYTVPLVRARRCRRSPGVAAERAESQRHAARHAKRLAKLLHELSERPVRSIPSACHGRAETVAAYRLLDHPGVGCDGILSGPKQATLERVGRHEGGG